MHQPKHQVYFSRKDYLRILQEYEQYELSSPTQQDLILVAKAYFIEEFYAQCIDVLKKIVNLKKAKILFERQVLMFKALYLIDYRDTDKLIEVIDEFEIAKRSVTDQLFTAYHLNMFKQFRQFVNVDLPRQMSKMEKFSPPEDSKLSMKTSGSFIKQRQKQLTSTPKIQGFPGFLVSSKWRKKQQSYYNNMKIIIKKKDKKFNLKQIQKDAEHPGPITNFEITNHIFEIIPYDSPSQSGLNLFLFPGEQFQVLTKKHWIYLNQIYGGFAVKRTLGKAERSRDQITFDETMTVKLVIQYQKNISVMQIPSISIWPYGVLPYLWKKYGNGQLKEENPQDNFVLVGNGKVFQPQNQLPLKYITFKNHNIHQLTTEDMKFQTRLFHTYDFERYDIDTSPSHGLVGLTNDKLLCFMNSTLQCLSNNYDMSRYFLSNQHVGFINYSKSNDIGSRGQITCAYADIIKKLWTLVSKSSREAQINPTVFKRVFAKRFQIFTEDSQEDAHEFMNFLLNCMHDDLNQCFRQGPNRMMKSARDSTNFQDVRRTFMENYESNNSSIITELFKGYTYSTLKCLSCEAKFYHFDMHLTFPLPIPAMNSTISVFYLSSENLQSQAVRYNIYLDDIQSVGDIIKCIQQKRSATNQSRYDKRRKFNFLIAIHKGSFKYEDHYPSDTEVSQLLKIQGKVYFILYDVFIEDFIQDTHSEDQDNNEDQIQKAQKQLTLIQYFYEDERRGHPKLILIDPKKTQNELIKIAAQSLCDQALHVSGGVATQSQKLDCISKVKLQKVKGKPFAAILKVKLAEKIYLFRQKEGRQFIGRAEKASEFTLENCFNIFREKDRINIEEGWRCEKCKKVSECEKEEKIYNVGSHLIIVLKRFKEGEKVCTKIQYPVENFDVTTYIDEHYRKSHPQQSFVYDLYGVVVHRGSLNRGHYFSYCKNKQTQKWYLFDDQLVREQDDMSYIVNQNAYILFYRKK